MEETIIRELTKKFDYLQGKVIIQRPRRIFLEVPMEHFLEVFEYLVKEFQFSHLCTITGFDEQERLGFMYHLAKDPGFLINIKTSVLKEKPVIKTVTTFFAGAEIYERELVDLFGAKVEGLPEGNRYPLTDDWPTDQFPLRKDWLPAAALERKENTHA